MQDSTFGIIPCKHTEGKNLFLLIKSRGGHWGFPKGHPKGNESGLETATRELYEETGIRDINIYTDQAFTETRISIETEFTVTKTIVWYVGVVAEHEIVTIHDIEEIVEYAWLRFDEAYETLSHTETKRVLLDVRMNLPKFIVSVEPEMTPL